MKNKIKKILQWLIEVQSKVNKIQKQQMFGKF